MHGSHLHGTVSEMVYLVIFVNCFSFVSASVSRCQIPCKLVLKNLRLIDKDIKTRMQLHWKRAELVRMHETPLYPRWLCGRVIRYLHPSRLMSIDYFPAPLSLTARDSRHLRTYKDVLPNS